jgi:hypothetical protein
MPDWLKLPIWRALQLVTFPTMFVLYWLVRLHNWLDWNLFLVQEWARR